MVQIMHISSAIASTLVLCFVCCIEFGTASYASTRKPNFASGRGGGISRPNIELASTPGDSHWFDEPPVLGPDPILSSEHENVNVDTSYVTQYAGEGHGKFWNYVKNHGDNRYGLRGPIGKRSNFVPYLTLRDSFGLGKVMSNTKDHFPLGQEDGDLPNTKIAKKVTEVVEKEKIDKAEK